MKSPFGKSVLAAACALLAAPDAGAVYRNVDGVGQALIFPYYSTRSADANPFNTYVSIVNHTADTKAIRVRFREGQNGREVAGFNLFLAGGDAWTAAVIPPVGPNRGARLVTVDRSCVSPAFSADSSSAVPYLEFRNALYASGNADGLGDGLDRTREGYIEAIEMATVPAGALADALRPAANTPPPDCSVGAQGTLVVAPPTGGLSGTLTLINVGNGLDFTANADALAELTALPFFRVASDPYPDFNSAEVNPVTHVLANGKSYRLDWTNRALAVSAAMARPAFDNEVVLDAATQSATDWVVTFPTKRLHPSAAGDPPPFAPSYGADRRTIPFGLAFRSREGEAANLVGACVGLCPPGTFTANLQLPYTTTVVGFRTGAAASGTSEPSAALGSTNAWIVTLPTTAQNGSASLFFDGFFTTPRFPAVNAQTLRLSDGVNAAETLRLNGLPAVGFAVRTFRNGSLACPSGTCQGNYGGLFPHRATLTTTP